MKPSRANLPLLLESPGKWRSFILTAYIVAMLVPSLWLTHEFLVRPATGAPANILGGSFFAALGRSVIQISWVTGWSFIVGCPFGLVLGLNRSTWSTVAQTLLAVPLFLPGFIWAIGLSDLKALLPYRFQGWLDGLSGCVLCAVLFTLPLAALCGSLAVRSLSRSHTGSAKIAGGRRMIYFLTFRYAWPVCLCAAALGAVLSAADPGPAQIMGYHGAASEVLIAMAGRHDLPLAAVKASGVIFALLPLAVLLAWQCAKRMDAELSGRDYPTLAQPPDNSAPLVSVPLVLTVVFVSAPLVGLALPFRNASAVGPLENAVGVLAQSAATTVIYGLATGVVGTAIGVGLALAVGRFVRLRRVALGFCFAFLASSSAVHALGVAILASAAPSWLDFLARSGALPVIALSSRFAPLSVIIWLWVAAGLPRSINHSAAMHGLPATTYLARILIPRCAPVLLASIVAIGLLSVADVSTLLLLQAPGQTTFAGRIFAVMDNTSARTVAALCLVYVAGGCFLISATALVSRKLLFDKGERAAAH